MNFIKKINSELQRSVFLDEDLKLVFPEKTDEQIHNSISYHLKTGELKRIKRGMYAFPENISSRVAISKVMISNMLYGPSYVSFESALSHHGLIPEAVYETTSACFQERKKLFKTPEGVFSFYHSPVKPFFLGVIQDEVKKGLIATPIRALFDLIYMRRSQYPSIHGLEEDLRLDLDELGVYLQSVSANEILTFGDLYKKTSTRNLAEILVKGFK